MAMFCHGQEQCRFEYFICPLHSAVYYPVSDIFVSDLVKPLEFKTYGVQLRSVCLSVLLYKFFAEDFLASQQSLPQASHAALVGKSLGFCQPAFQ